MIHGIVNLWLLDDFDDLGNDLVGWWFVGSGVLAGTGAAEVNLLGVDADAQACGDTPSSG